MIKNIIIVTLLTLSISCTHISTVHSTTPQEDACKVVYCEESEYSVRKKAGLKLMEIAAGVYNIDLSLDRGICTQYYKNRVFPDYRYANKSAIDVCNNKINNQF